MDTFDFLLPNDYENEIAAFLLMCTPKDINFLSIPDSERTAKDYVRLMYIAIALQSRSTLLRIIREIEDCNRMDDIDDYVQTIPNIHNQAKIWVDEFIEDIPLPPIKTFVKKAWQKQVRQYKRKHKKRIHAMCAK